MFVELLLNGLVEGSLLALIAVGYSLAYGSARIINFAHADVMIASGGYLVLLWLEGTVSPITARIVTSVLFGSAASFTTLVLFRSSDRLSVRRVLLVGGIGFAITTITYSFTGHLPFVLAFVLAIPWSAILAGAVYSVVYLPLLRKNAPRTSVLLAALGISIAIESILLIAWGSQQRVFPTTALPTSFVVQAAPDDASLWETATKFGVILFTREIQLPVHDVLIVLTFVIVALSLYLFFKFSRTADAIIASADSILAAKACGISVEKIFAQAFLLGGAIACAGGTLYVIRAKALYPTAGFSLGILAFAACVLGGIGSLRGSIAGAFLTSLVISFAPAVPVEQWISSTLPATWVKWLPSLNLGDWSYGVVYMLMIVIILFKPKGLFQE